MRKSFLRLLDSVLELFGGILFILMLVSALTLLLLTSPIWGTYMSYVWSPILRAIDQQPLYWMNWKEIKLASGKSTSQVLHCLKAFSGPNDPYDIKLRPEEDLLRLEQLLATARPTTARPMTHREVVFYEYRRKGGGGRRWRVKPDAMMPPVLQPARV